MPPARGRVCPRHGLRRSPCRVGRSRDRAVAGRASDQSLPACSQKATRNKSVTLSLYTVKRPKPVLVKKSLTKYQSSMGKIWLIARRASKRPERAKRSPATTTVSRRPRWTRRSRPPSPRGSWRTAGSQINHRKAGAAISSASEQNCSDLRNGYITADLAQVLAFRRIRQHHKPVLPACRVRVDRKHLPRHRVLPGADRLERHRDRLAHALGLI